MAAAFYDATTRRPEGVWESPGRVNLIGDHTDHSAGFVLPFAIDRRVAAAAGRRGDGGVRVWSLQEASSIAFDAAEIGPDRPVGWAAHVAGAVWALGRRGLDVRGIDVVVDGDVPRASGLASSAALGCATALAVAELYGAELDRVELALAAQAGEVEIVGVPCGVMDQMAAMCCRDGNAMFLDTRTLAHEHVPLSLGELATVVVNVGVERRLVASGYAQRRAECEAAARQLGVGVLRDATLEDVGRLADATLRQRARHVISENQRVLDAVAALRHHDVDGLGELLTASLASLRDDFDVSTPELDDAVEAARRAGALGARMTGGGFGGCVIALLARDAIADLREHLAVSAGGRRQQLFEVAPANGARRVA